MDHETMLNELDRLEAALQRLIGQWRARQEEGRDATAIESALFAAAQKVATAGQRVQVLYKEDLARQRQSPVLPLDPVVAATAA